LEKIEHEKEIVICEKAIDTFGYAHQKLKIIEELGELLSAIARSLNDEKNNVEEEIADVEVVLAQARLMFDENKIDEIKKAKLERLKELVW
jgi:NTP pyrophosphatase (non-canonical NTP hydrolase)